MFDSCCAASGSSASMNPVGKHSLDVTSVVVPGGDSVHAEPQNAKWPCDTPVARASEHAGGGVNIVVNDPIVSSDIPG